MTRITFHVSMDTDGDADELARSFEQYISTPGPQDLGFLSDYARDGVYSIASGYEGPFVESIGVVRTS